MWRHVFLIFAEDHSRSAEKWFLRNDFPNFFFINDISVDNLDVYTANLTQLLTRRAKADSLVPADSGKVYLNGRWQL